MSNPLVLLTVAGTDSGGAAGVAADLTTFAALGAHGACVVTAVTAQDTTGVHDVHPIPPPTVASQLDAVTGDLPVAAVKTGMLGTADTVRVVAQRLAGVPLVVDPVLVATSGGVLGDASVRDAYLTDLLPVAAVTTPNLDEARALLGAAGPADRQADRLAAGLSEICPAAVLTGGTDDGTECTDWVAVRGRAPVPLRHPVVPTRNDHGTGCTFSAALAVHLAAGLPLLDAARAAGEFTTERLRTGSAWTLGRGRGPIAHTHTPGGST